MNQSKTALLVMDLQVGIVERFATNGVLDTFKKAISAARTADMPVIFVRVAFREGFPEVSHNNLSFSAIANNSGMTQEDASTQIHPDLDPKPQDVIVVKRRVSAFTGSDLDVVLRGLDVDTLVLSGIATSGVVLSTLRQAADMDYKLQVLSDACIDADPEVHRVLTEKVFPRQAKVLTVDEWTKSISQ